ncbi:ParB/RepB/Spo0J family partition protein [Rhodococcus sp. D-46]|uniref:ParB/RepB/Spo0J family partition protein n=1 Tax=unclassified Rhodococcus (in: high G+C Gram-positive bacteria) TaxID=192944 RepID=UPI0006BA46B1|nr:ParB/RepB/Spo0J family partition protein [Rhodococcus sp. ADH]KPH21412.1 peptide transporter [Rhodococcus sp. ADH]NHE68814.1 ParB/RepB/Spo0J family partition protein [Rhodococcus sp. D-46]RGP47368.1 peptide transporter [Rhodococcus erythropolis]
MARRGGRIDLASLAGAVGEYSSVDRTPAPTSTSRGGTEKSIDGAFFADVPLGELVGNPRNPRRRMGDLSDLSTIADRQLQPGVVVTKATWLTIFPADSNLVGAARYIVVNGNRRLAASKEFGRKGMDVIVRDSIATSSESILEAAIIENIGRRDFDVLEEAEAVEALVAECGSADAAAERLGRSKGWVSQRRALLKLTPELQEKLRAGEIAIRLARSLAQVPFEGQVKAWRIAQERAEKQSAEKVSDDVNSGVESVESVAAAATVKAVRSLRSLRQQGVRPELLADALREIYTVEECRSLRDALEQ